MRHSLLAGAPFRVFLTAGRKVKLGKLVELLKWRHSKRQVNTMRRRPVRAAVTTLRTWRLSRRSASATQRTVQEATSFTKRSGVVSKTIKNNVMAKKSLQALHQVCWALSRCAQRPRGCFVLMCALTCGFAIVCLLVEIEKPTAMDDDAAAVHPDDVACLTTTTGDAELPEPQQERLRVAVIVPFRDNHAAQKRQAHLEQFVPHMTALLSKQSELWCVHRALVNNGVCIQ